MGGESRKALLGLVLRTKEPLGICGEYRDKPRNRKVNTGVLSWSNGTERQMWRAIGHNGPVTIGLN